MNRRAHRTLAEPSSCAHVSRFTDAYTVPGLFAVHTLSLRCHRVATPAGVNQ